MEIRDEILENVSPILEQQDKIQRIVEAVSIPKIDIPSLMSNPLKEVINNSTAKILQDNLNLDIINNLINQTSYQFENHALKTIEVLNNSSLINLAEGFTTLVTNPLMKELQFIASNISNWLQKIDFSPLTSILENLHNIRFDYDLKEVNEVFLKAMFDARWFPYAGWIADLKIMDTMLKILDTSRASKNRIKRIDKLIFSYYNKEEINSLKCKWRQINLPSYMIRILVQCVQAYHRREYALTVSTLSTLWEGIIQEKVHDDGYRISRKTRKNLKKLIEKNEFDKIFSSFCEEFIFYNCNNVNEVKQDVPGRHGIAHCWYNIYPSRKMALNAILFTDFLLDLKPLEKEEEEING